MNDTPNFATWERQTLEKFAMDAYIKLQQQEDQIAHLRGDLKDAMQLLRSATVDFFNGAKP